MKFTYPRLLGALLAPLLAAGQPASANVDISFDYRYDPSGFLTGANSSRQSLLDAAASVFETRFQDNLTAITSSGSNKFDATFFRPDNGSLFSIPRYSVGADQIVIFAGGRDLGGTLAIGGPGGWRARGYRRGI